ncbi:hypothetical protein DL768_008868 [Monosporascus sp. mg162]|nr:hypothetical protein DL768_008868 [Monosporascus sp. mg162]
MQVWPEFENSEPVTHELRPSARRGSQIVTLHISMLPRLSRRLNLPAGTRTTLLRTYYSYHGHQWRRNLHGVRESSLVYLPPLAISLLAAQGLTLHLGSGYDQNEHPEGICRNTGGGEGQRVMLLPARIRRDEHGARLQMAVRLLCRLALAFMLAPILICRPVSAHWTGLGKCDDLVPLIEWSIITNVASDLVIMWLPMPSILSLQARKTDKISVMACFALGHACVVCCLVRLIHTPAADATEKLTATLPTTLFLLILEPNIAIICVSIPMLRPLYSMYRKRKGGSRLREVSDKRTTASGGGRSGRSGQRSRGAIAAITSQNNTIDWEMEDYRTDMVAQHDTTVTAVADDSGLEENLTSSEPATRKCEGAIRVETVWTMSRN